MDAASKGFIDALFEAADLKTGNMAQCSSACTTLHDAVKRDCIDCVSRQLQFGCHVNEQDVHGDTPLHVAVKRGCDDITAMLAMHAELDPSIVNKLGYDLLHYAVHRQNQRAVKEILRRSSHLWKRTDVKGYAPIHSAAAAGDSKMIDLLMGSEDADLELRDTDFQRTPLLLAVQNLQLSGAMNLVKRGANISAQDVHGNTSLHYAILIYQKPESKECDKIKCIDIIKYLLKVGADPLIENVTGQSAYDSATDHQIFRLVSRHVMSALRSLRGYLCVVCKARPREIRFHPCGHCVACRECCLQVGTCPSCSGCVEQHQKSVCVKHKESADPCVICGLEDRIQQLESQILCPSCLVADRKVVYSCGHALCSHCAVKVGSRCPTCRKRSSWQAFIYL